MNKTTQQTHIMNNKLILPLLSLLLASFVSAQINVPTSCTVDLDIDSDNDNTWLNPEEDDYEESIEMISPGKMIMLNRADSIEDTAILVLKHATTDTSETVTLTAPENSVRIYKMDGTTVVIGPGVGSRYVMQQHPKEYLIVEGLQVGKATLKLACTGGPSDEVLVSIVKVDVTIGGVGEEKEETEGACLAYQPYDPMWIDEIQNKLLAVSIKCWPTDLPSTEMVKIEAPQGFLYEKIGVEYSLAQTSYKACEVGQKQFFLHGHVASETLMDRSIIVTHEKSRAEDKANFTVNKVEIVVELEDPKINSVRSGLNLATIKFILNGNQIDYEKLAITVEETEWLDELMLDGLIVCKVKVTYAPTLDELSTSSSGNRVTVDVEDNVKNAMEQQVKTFIVNSGNGY